MAARFGAQIVNTRKLYGDVITNIKEIINVRLHTFMKMKSKRLL
jgi:hypothetical protein